MQFNLEKKLKAGIIGHVVGDALGVPVEFKSRKELKKDPVTDMQGYGSYNQPPGTWSDDSSLTLCLLESLLKGYDLNDQAEKFISWLDDAYWTARGETFDVGNTTRNSISNLRQGIQPTKAGAAGERDNGNGSLMRILPLAFYLIDMQSEQRFEKTKEVSSLTHSHPRSILGCYIYLDYALRLIKGNCLTKSYKETIEHVNQFIKKDKFSLELKYYSRILTGKIKDLRESNIKSTGYIVDTLEAVFWVLLNSNSYEESVLKAVNLGQDTDTIAAITGGLAGIHYGFDSIPEKWIKQISRLDDILELSRNFSEEISK